MAATLLAMSSVALAQQGGGAAPATPAPAAPSPASKPSADEQWKAFSDNVKSKAGAVDSKSAAAPAATPAPAAAAAPKPAAGAAQAKPAAAKSATAAPAPKGAGGKPAAAKGTAPKETPPAPLEVPMAPSAEPPAERMKRLRQTAVESYNQRGWDDAADAAAGYLEAMASLGLPKAGADYALVAFISGHAHFEQWKRDPANFKGEFERDILGPMEDSLKILQDDPFFKLNILGSAYYEQYRAAGWRGQDYENRAHWTMFRALLARADELAGKPRDGEEYTAFAKFLLQYIGRAFEMARRSPTPDVYLVRVREAARLGMGSSFDERFVQLFEVVGFDNANVRAGVLWQTALDQMNTEGSKPEETFDVFRQAATATRGNKEKAEVYRQMADYASRLDGYRQPAVDYGRQAFRLDPENKDIQVQYGTSLHVLSYAHYNNGRYQDALSAAAEATQFAWEGDELAYFDLARAQASFGDKVNALVNAEKAFDKARRRLPPAEVAPFRQNFANILRQFGFAAKAAEVESAVQGS